MLSTDTAARRKAFRKLKKLFPDERRARFDADLNILLCDLIDAEDLDEALQRARDLVETNREELSHQQLAAGEILIALALYQQDLYEEAAPIAIRIAEDERLLPEARAGAASLACELVAVRDPARALAFAEQALTLHAAPEVTVDEMGTFWMFLQARLAHEAGGDLAALTRQFLDTQTSEDRREILRDSFLWVPEKLIDYGHPEAARALLMVLEDLAEDDDSWREENRESFEELHEVIEKLAQVEPLRQKLHAWLDRNPWPHFEQVEEGDRIECASEATPSLIDPQPERDLRYQLRALVSFGPQPQFADDAQHAVELAENWIAARLDPKSETPEPPVDLEALLDVLLETWSGAPDGEWADAGDAHLARGEVVLRREGEAAAIAHYRALAEDEKVREGIRSTAWDEAAELHARRSEFAQVLDAWDRASALGTGPDQNRILQGVYLSLDHGMREEAWKRLEILAGIPEPEFSISFTDGALRAELSGFVADRPGSEQWWDASAAWWPDWQQLAAVLKIKPLDGLMRYYQPWTALDNFPKQLTQVLERKNLKPRRAAFKDLLAETLGIARWHPSAAPGALELLEAHAVELFPKSARAFAQLAAAFREAHELQKPPKEE
jgi:hypothetical protein